MAQHARPVGPTTNAAATFSQEMAIGSMPDRPYRFSSRHAFGPQMLSPITPVAAPFSQEMARGSFPSSDIRPNPFTTGGTFQPPEVLSFGIESIVRSRPSSPRLFLAPRMPLPVSQTTHVSAPISPEMTTGWQPAATGTGGPFTRGNVFLSPDILSFSVEMALGSRPDRPRLFSTRAVTSHQTLAETTPVALFSVEMAVGVKPATSVRSAPWTRGGVVTAPDVSPFSVEMVQGWAPSRARLFSTRAVTSHQTISQPTFTAAPFSVEMVIGARPDRSRSFLAPRIPLPLAQTISFAVVLSPRRFAITASMATALSLTAMSSTAAARTTTRTTAVASNAARGTTPATPASKTVLISATASEV